MSITMPLALSPEDQQSEDQQTVVIDGSQGEGGGQVLRSSLSLSAITGRPLRIESIRARRRKPGLRAQHLTCVRAAAAICGARAEGAELASDRLSFEPGRVSPGDYRFDIGTAGSVTLVLQTVLPPLLLVNAPSRLTLVGGTHNPMAPSFDFLRRAFLPLFERCLGAKVEARLERHGFYPKGGGRIEVAITPSASSPGRLVLEEAGPVIQRRARAIVANLPEHVARRELDIVGRELRWTGAERSIEQVESDGPGNVVMLEVERTSDNGVAVAEIVSGFGERGVRAEKVAKRAVVELRRYLEGDWPVGAHLADQLLLPLCLGAGGSFVTGPLTNHTETNIAVIERFVDASITREALGQATRVMVSGSRPRLSGGR